MQSQFQGDVVDLSGLPAGDLKSAKASHFEVDEKAAKVKNRRGQEFPSYALDCNKAIARWRWTKLADLRP